MNSENPKQRLSHNSVEVRRRAALDIADLDSADAVDLFIQALGDLEWRVRKEAVAIASKLYKRGHPRLIPRLIDEMVQEDHIGLRNAACEALTSIGNDAIEIIIDRMPSFHEGGRKIAIEVLGASEHPRAIDELITRLSDADWNVRACAAEWLGEKSDEKAANALIDCLQDGDHLVILSALQSLNRMGKSVPWKVLKPFSNMKILGSELLLALGRCGEPEAITILVDELGVDPVAARAIELMHGTSQQSAAAVEEALHQIDDEQIYRLISETTKGEPLEQRAAANCVLWTRRIDLMEAIVELSANESLYPILVNELTYWGEDAIEQLFRMIDRVDGQKRAPIVGLLTRLLDNEKGREYVHWFAEFLESEDAALATAAASAVSRFGDPSVIGRLLNLTNSPFERVRRSAGHALRQLGNKYPDQVRLAISDVEISGVQGIELCKTLEVVGSEKEADQLSIMLASPTPQLRAAAIKALAGIKGADAVDTIALAMTDEDLHVQMAAAASLGRIGSGASETIVSALRMAKGPLKAALIRTLGEVGHPEAEEILLSLCMESADVALASLEAIHALGLNPEGIQDCIWGHSDNEVLKQALSYFGSNLTGDSFGKLLKNAKWDVRLAAVEHLAEKPDGEIIELLRRHLENETDYLVIRAIDGVLGGRSHEG